MTALRKPAATALVAGALALSACTSPNGSTGESDNAAQSGSETAPTAVDAGRQGSVVQLEDGYCRAKPAVDDAEAHSHLTEKDKKHADMTACFGTLKNTSGKDVRVESFSSPTLKDATTELHEVVDGVMREKEGGFTVPGNGTYSLTPGGDHLMIMDYPGAIAAGDKLTFEITFEDGSMLTVDMPVREQPSGEENYAGGSDSSHEDTPATLSTPTTNTDTRPRQSIND